MCNLGFAAVTNSICELNSAEVSKVYVVVLWLEFGLFGFFLFGVLVFLWGF